MPSSTQGLITITANTTTITSTATTTTDTATSDYIPRSQFNTSIPTVNNNLSSSNTHTDSTDLFQKSSTQHEYNQEQHTQQQQSNQLIDPINTIQRFTILPPQKQYNTTVSQTECSSTYTNSSQSIFPNHNLFNYDGTILTETTAAKMAVSASTQASTSPSPSSGNQQLSPPPPPPPSNIINRDIFLNNSRVNSNFVNSHAYRNGVHHYSEPVNTTANAADIVSEMNQIYKQSMFMRRSGPDDDLNPFNSNIPLHRESTFNRIGNCMQNLANYLFNTYYNEMKSATCYT